MKQKKYIINENKYRVSQLKIKVANEAGAYIELYALLEPAGVDIRKVEFNYDTVSPTQAISFTDAYIIDAIQKLKDYYIDSTNIRESDYLSESEMLDTIKRSGNVETAIRLFSEVAMPFLQNESNLDWFVQEWIQDHTVNPEIISLIEDSKTIKRLLEVVKYSPREIYIALRGYGYNMDGRIDLNVLDRLVGIRDYDKEGYHNLRYSQLKKATLIENKEARRRDPVDFSPEAVSKRLGIDVSQKGYQDRIKEGSTKVY